MIFLLLKQGKEEEHRKNYEQPVIYFCKALELDLNSIEVKKALKKMIEWQVCAWLQFNKIKAILCQTCKMMLIVFLDKNMVDDILPHKTLVHIIV